MLGCLVCEDAPQVLAAVRGEGIGNLAADALCWIKPSEGLPG
jgi:hypothetical protein